MKSWVKYFLYGVVTLSCVGLFFVLRSTSPSTSIKASQKIESPEVKDYLDEQDRRTSNQEDHEELLEDFNEDTLYQKKELTDKYGDIQYIKTKSIALKSNDSYECIATVYFNERNKKESVEVTTTYKVVNSEYILSGIVY